MTRRRWTGLAGVLFGVLMFVGVTMSGETPESGGSGAVERYAQFWSDADNQSNAAWGTFVLTYGWIAMLAFGVGLRTLLRRYDDGPLPTFTVAATAVSTALFAVGAALVNGVGIAAEESGYEPDGGHALLVEGIGYYTLTVAAMSGAAAFVAAGVSGRRTGVLPSWTLVLTGLIALAALGSVFTAWINFMLLPVWGVVVGIVLLATQERAGAAAPDQELVTA